MNHHPWTRQKGIVQAGQTGYHPRMTRLDTVEKLALELPEHQRATLALHMLHSLPGLFSEPDGGLAEAERRDAELDADPSIALDLKDLDAKISGRRE